MCRVSQEAAFIVWGPNYTPFGPVELGTLMSLVKDARVTADTWVYTTHGGAWLKADRVPELSVLFHTDDAPRAFAEAAVNLDPLQLRRIHVLSNLTDAQLGQFARYLRVECVPESTVVVKEGEPGDSMFLVLEGELRVRIRLMGKEITLARLGSGEFFGDISLFDQAPRAVDVIASLASTLLRITSASFNELAKQAPDLATPFLLAIGKTLTARIRDHNAGWAGRENRQPRSA